MLKKVKAVGLIICLSSSCKTFNYSSPIPREIQTIPTPTSIGFGLSSESLTWMSVDPNTAAGVVGGTFVAGTTLVFLKELGQGKPGVVENDIRKSKIYGSWEKQIDDLSDSEVSRKVREDFGKIKNELDLRARLGQSEKLNIMMIKIELGGGHKTAIDGLKNAITKYLPLEDQKRINFIVVDMFGPFAHGGAKEFNKILETEDAEKLVKGLGGKPRLEKLYDTWAGKQAINKSLDYGLKEFAVANNIGDIKLLKPDLVLSPQPFGLHALHDVVSKRFNTQLRIIPTDFFIGDWLQEFGAIDADDPSIRYDVFSDDGYIKGQALKKGVRSLNYAGFPIRSEIMALVDDLYFNGSASRRKVESEIFDTVKSMSGGSYKKIDSSMLIMMGSKSVPGNRYNNYLEGVFEDHGHLKIEKGGKLHIFVAGIEPRPPNSEEKTNPSKKRIYENYLKDQMKVSQEVHSRLEELKIKYPDAPIEVHLKGYVGAREVGSLMHNGVTLTKAGGATAAEIASIGGRALFNMRISNVAPWEKGNADFLTSKGLGFQLPTDDLLERRTLIRGFNQFTELDKIEGRSPLGRNQFNKTWSSTVMRDLKFLMQYKQPRIKF